LKLEPAGLKLAPGKYRQQFLEFVRYAFVGGAAFLVDYGLFWLSKEFVFNAFGDIGVYLATALGFISGLMFNYILSIVFVFKSAREQNKGKSVGGFMLFATIGVVGLLMSEGGMMLFYGAIGIHYLIAKVLVSGIVLIWNYAARKLLIFR
jgi:putative flippase GtrA